MAVHLHDASLIDPRAAQVAALEEHARRDPGGYRRRVVRFALLAYAYVGFVFLLLLSLVVLAFVGVAKGDGSALLLVVFAGGALWAVGRSMWVSVPPAKGVALTPESHPELLSELAALRRRIGGPALDRVVIVPDFNAAVLPRPRAGLLGLYRHELLIGLPYMASVTKDELRAALAHELGHLAGGDGKSLVFVSRLRTAWLNLGLLWQLQQHWASFMVTWFFQWFAPRFEMLSFVLMRAHERRADRWAAEATSAEACARSLTEVSGKGFWYETVLVPRLRRELLAEGARDGMTRAVALLASEPSEADARRALKMALLQETAPHDTHPSVAERVEALGVEPPEALGPPEESAARAWLGESLGAIAAELDPIWWKESGLERAVLALDAEEEQERLEELERLSAADVVLPVVEVVELARLSVRYRSPEVALQRLRDALEAEPDEEELRLELGRAQALSGDPGAIETLEPLSGGFGRSAIEATLYLAFAAADADRTGLARVAFQRLARLRGQSAQAMVERAVLTHDTKTLPHGLDDVELRPLVTFLRNVEGVEAAWLARRQVQYLPEIPAYVLGILTTGAGQSITMKPARQTLAHILEHAPVPPGTLIAAVDEDFALRHKLETTERSRLVP